MITNNSRIQITHNKTRSHDVFKFKLNSIRNTYKHSKRIKPNNKKQMKDSKIIDNQSEKQMKDPKIIDNQSEKELKDSKITFDIPKYFIEYIDISKITFSRLPYQYLIPKHDVTNYAEYILSMS